MGGEMDSFRSFTHSSNRYCFTGHCVSWHPKARALNLDSMDQPPRKKSMAHKYH